MKWAGGSILMIAVMALAFSGGAARGDDLPTRPMRVRWNQGSPHVQLAARDFVDASVRDKLNSGLPQRIISRVYAFGASNAPPLALSFRSCRVVYDLWEDVYRVELETSAGDRSMRLRSETAVTELCLQVDDIQVGRRADYARQQGRAIYFSVLIELNPMSPDTVQRIRNWLSRSGGARGLQRQDAFFGSFVSIFVNRRIGDAEHTLRYRSPRLMVP